MSRYILTMDPGLKSGVTMYDRETGKFFSDELGFDDMCRLLMLEANDKRGDLVVVSESFIITQQTPKNTQAPWSLELIGVARMVSRLYCGHELTKQDPGSAKRFASDARLKHMGWHKPSKGHANDAARHLLLVLATRAWISQSTLKELTDV